MAAYVIVNIEVFDPAGYEEYRPLAAECVARHGGRFLVRGGAFEVREGKPDWKRVIVLEFPDMATARRWYDSPEYQRALAMRVRTSHAELILVEGL